MVRWRKAAKDNKEKFMVSSLASLAVVIRSHPLRPKRPPIKEEKYTQVS